LAARILSPYAHRKRSGDAPATSHGPRLGRTATRLALPLALLLPRLAAVLFDAALKLATRHGLPERRKRERRKRTG
jgi:hypothetical protein